MHREGWIFCRTRTGLSLVLVTAGNTSTARVRMAMKTFSGFPLFEDRVYPPEAESHVNLPGIRKILPVYFQPASPSSFSSLTTSSPFRFTNTVPSIQRSPVGSIG